jgi:hypothetical protein
MYWTVGSKIEMGYNSILCDLRITLRPDVVINPLFYDILIPETEPLCVLTDFINLHLFKSFIN